MFEKTINISREKNGPKEEFVLSVPTTGEELLELYGEKRALDFVIATHVIRSRVQFATHGKNMGRQQKRKRRLARITCQPKREKLTTWRKRKTRSKASGPRVRQTKRLWPCWKRRKGRKPLFFLFAIEHCVVSHPLICKGVFLCYQINPLSPWQN